MGLQDIIALVIVAAALLFVGRKLWRTLAGRGTTCSCPSGKKSCPASRAVGVTGGSPGSAPEHGPRSVNSSRDVGRDARRLPVVTPDQIGKPPPKPSQMG